MLTETQKWRLERGLSLLECGYYSCKSCPNHTDERNMWTGHCWIEEGSFCPVEYSDWQDAAEFEARVAAKLVSNNFPCRNCPDFLIGTKCPITTRGTDTDYGPFPCLLRQARLAVEEEMENGRTV